MAGYMVFFQNLTGKPSHLFYDGYLYTLKTNRKNKKYWCCSQATAKSCKASATTDEKNDNLHTHNHHSHARDVDGNMRLAELHGAVCYSQDVQSSTGLLIFMPNFHHLQ